VDFLEARRELKKMRGIDLFNMEMDQKLSKCLVGGMTCGYSMLYKGIRFCVSEVMGKGCLIERLGQWEKFYPEKRGTNDYYPFLQTGSEELSPGKNSGEFKVYYKDDLTQSMVYLGRVIERRKKERGNNLGNLLKKATKEYSDYVPDPSKIFLLGY